MKNNVRHLLVFCWLIFTTLTVCADNTPYSSAKTPLYKNLYYNMPKNEVMQQYNTEQDPDNQNQLISYNQSFLGFQWTMILIFNQNNLLESVYLETDSDANGNKLWTLLAAIGKNFSIVYGTHDSNSIDFVSIIKEKGQNATQKAFEDFWLDAISHSTSLNIIAIDNDSVQGVLGKVNNYMSLLHRMPDTARQAELVVVSDEDDNICLGVNFTLPKKQLINVQNQSNEDF
ncbi:hypothetical protein GA0061081_10360 [Gilliamella bombicola]|uniref:Uncharacterized protein n=1 Tax=Gilliamella bombicola TaxID=1798182 RepID=A0A1C4ANL6_9GAMM|nr:hypothetical protein [Gilliamella bombicola]SCB96220.1 hypothetical protein GA0061081_10360 [Gilliamella bombicola]